MLVQLLLVASSAGSAEVAYPPLGTSDCPCIDPFSNASDWTLTGVDAGACDGLVDRGGSCYQRAYGAARCEAWDSDSAACSVSDPPSWCANIWCWVDQRRCLRPNDHSRWFSAVRLERDDGRADQLHFSYEACGNLNLYSNDESMRETLLRTASRGPLRISMPGDSSNRYSLVTASPGVQGTGRDGT